MTENEKAIHKEKVKKVMVDHLTTLGYPNVEPDLIMRELKNMWVKVEEAGLIVEDMNFQAFANFANHWYMISQINGVVGI